MSSETMQLLNAVIPAAAAILGAAVGVLGTIIVTNINKKSEERKHIRSLAINAGIENFKGAVEVSRIHKGTTLIPPLDSFILNMKLMADILLEDDLTPDCLREKLRERNEMVNTMIEIAEEQTNKLDSREEKGT